VLGVRDNRRNLRGLTFADLRLVRNLWSMPWQRGSDLDESRLTPMESAVPPDPMPEIVIVANPATDERFCEEIDRLAEGAWSPRELENGLVAVYPKAKVVAGVTQGPTDRWYAYREGRWINPLKP
jgi:hypothetical protein